MASIVVEHALAVDLEHKDANYRCRRCSDLPARGIRLQWPRGTRRQQSSYSDRTQSLLDALLRQSPMGLGRVKLGDRSSQRLAGTFR